MSAEVLHTTDHGRVAARAFLRLEITEHAAVVVVHELGPPRGPDDGEARHARWRAWVDSLQPPLLEDDLGTDYRRDRVTARGAGGNPRTDHLPMKATLAWRFLPGPPAHARAFTVDRRWTVQR